MHNEDVSGRGSRGETRARRAGLLAGALASLALLAAACGSSPAGTGAASAGPSSHGSARSGGLALARCMRSHGVPGFPDPDSQGGISITAGDGVDINSPQFQAAQRACQKLAGAQPLNSAQQARVKAGNIKYAGCMRAQGISDFPDPDSQGQFAINAQPGSDLDPASPRYQAANKSCQHYQYAIPGGSGPSLSQPGGGA